MDTIVYQIGNSLYINMTNKCSNNCSFCIRKNEDFHGLNLWLEKEPSASEVISAIGDPTLYEEVVFCGFGEPLYRYQDIVTVAKFVKSKGVPTRINTNGQAMLIIGENIVPYLEDCIDTINISLNDVSAAEYKKLCAPIFGEMAYYALIDFARCCVGHIKNVVLSVVDVIGEDKIKKAQAIADSIGCTLRVRRYEQ